MILNLLYLSVVVAWFTSVVMASVIFMVVLCFRVKTPEQNRRGDRLHRLLPPGGSVRRQG